MSLIRTARRLDPVRSLSILLAGSIAATSTRAQLTERVSVATSGAQGNGQSIRPTISEDGRYVAFASAASDLATVDTNGVNDVFVRDRATGTTILLSEKFGQPGTTVSNGTSMFPRITGDGRYVVFASGGTDMLAVPANPGFRLWRKDLSTGALATASVRNDGTPIGFASGSDDFEVSSNGRYVVFVSGDTLIVPGDTNNGIDVFIHDFQAGTTVRASVDAGGQQVQGLCATPAISDNGRWVLFTAVAPSFAQGSGNPHLFLKDMVGGALTLVDVTSGGAVGVGSAPTRARLTSDGRYAVWQNAEGNISNNPILLEDLVTHVREAIAVDNFGVIADNTCAYPNISHDGRFVTFWTSAMNLGASPSTGTEIALRDRLTHTTSLASRSTAGASSNAASTYGAISGDGRFVAFQSAATNLDAVDTNGVDDVYLRDRFAGGVFEYCVAQANSQGCSPHVSATGVPSASAGAGFDIHCANVLNNKQGLLFYGVNGSQAATYLGGYLCVRPPTIRTATQSSGGSTSGTDCSGQFDYDFNARIASGIDPNLIVGTDVAAQFWSRDPAAATTTSLSDAVRFTIKP